MKIYNYISKYNNQIAQNEPYTMSPLPKMLSVSQHGFGVDVCFFSFALELQD